MQKQIQSIKTESVSETHKLAEQVAEQLHAGDVLCLQGELGSGKTCLVQGMAPRFGIESSAIQSPTFTLIHEYDRDGYLPLYHIDCYRLKREMEAVEIGMEDYFYGNGVAVVEWPERIQSLLPEEPKWIRIDIMDRQTRQFFISNFSFEFGNLGRYGA